MLLEVGSMGDRERAGKLKINHSQYPSPCPRLAILKLTIRRGKYGAFGYNHNVSDE
jgi:hypothetical protein